MSSTSVRLYFSGDAYFEQALKAIQEARHEVLVESYIYDLDPIGLRFLYALEAAVKRGVRVCLMVDGIGTFNWLRELKSRCEGADIPFRVYNPLPLNSRFQLSWRSLRRWLRFFRRVNQRNHRKTILIDHHRVFLGSLNFTQVHTREFQGAQAWRDTGVQLRFPEHHPDPRLLREAYLQTWKKSRPGRLQVYPFQFWNTWKKRGPPKSCFRLNSHVWWRYLLFRDLMNRVRTARKRILITNAYFLPRRSILAALREAARRGVYVGLVLPQKTDVWFIREAARSLYDRLLKDGVHIFEYQPSILHAKTVVIDNWATVGSYNLNHRSFMHDLEVDAVIEDPVSIDQLIQQWDKDAALSIPITREELHLNWPRKVLARVIYWFRYWL